MLTEASGLTGHELDAIADLEQRVLSSDGGRLKLEWGTLRDRPNDRVSDLLWWESGVLIGFAGIYQFGPDVEVAGMVEPAARRQGIGTALLDRALSIVTCRGQDHALLVVPRSTPAGGGFARSRGAVLNHSEHFLVLGQTPSERPGYDDLRLRTATAGDDEEVRRILADTFGSPLDQAPGGEDDPSRRQLVIEKSGSVIGVLRLNSDRGTTGIYGFGVDPSMQGQGIGRDALLRVCDMVRQRSDQQVVLEVAAHNDRALNLYLSVGFERRTTEDYYRLSAGGGD